MFGPTLRGEKCTLRPPRKEEAQTYRSCTQHGPERLGPDLSGRGGVVFCPRGQRPLLADDVAFAPVEREFAPPAALRGRDVVEGPPLRHPVRRRALQDDAIANLARHETVHLVEGWADRGHIPRAVRWAVEADRRLVVAHLPARRVSLIRRRRDDHVLDRTPLERPEEVPLPTQGALGAVGQTLVRLDVPAADELAEEHERIAVR